MKNNGMREKKRMRNETVEGILKTKQNKHEHLGGETFQVLNIIMHCINYSNGF